MVTNMLFVKTLSPRFHKKHLEIVVVLKGTITVHKLDRTEVCHEGQFVIIIISFLCLLVLEVNPINFCNYENKDVYKPYQK